MTYEEWVARERELYEDHPGRVWNEPGDVEHRWGLIVWEAAQDALERQCDNRGRGGEQCGHCHRCLRERIAQLEAQASALDEARRHGRTQARLELLAELAVGGAR